MDGHVRGDDARDSVLDVTTAGRTGNEHRIALARCMGLGALLIPLYYVLDVFVGYTLYGTGHLAVVIAVRAAAIVIAAAAWWIARDARFSDRTARVSHAIGLGLVAAAMSVLAYLHGGMVSPYIQGLTVMIMVRSATVPAPWRESVPHGVLVVMMYPAVFALIYASDPAAHAAWLTQDALALFLANWLIVVGAIFCGSLGSHATWVWKRQLFQARKLGRYRLQAPIGKGGMRGTPAYMAPEVCRGGDAGPGADLYGLGATLYHLLAGAPPFTGQDAEIIAKHLDATPEPLLTRAPVDADLEAVILRCLAKAPGERYADAAALRRALEQCAAAGAWTPEHATRFWRDERQSALARWEAETLP